MPDPALTMSPAQRLAGYLNAIDTDADASELRVDEADLIARIYNALGAGPTVSHLTTHVATMLAGIRNNLSSDPDQSAATTEVDVLFGEVLDLLEAAYGDAGDGGGGGGVPAWVQALQALAADPSDLLFAYNFASGGTGQGWDGTNNVTLTVAQAMAATSFGSWDASNIVDGLGLAPLTGTTIVGATPLGIIPEAAFRAGTILLETRAYAPVTVDTRADVLGHFVDNPGDNTDGGIDINIGGTDPGVASALFRSWTGSVRCQDAVDPQPQIMRAVNTYDFDDTVISGSVNGQAVVTGTATTSELSMDSVYIQTRALSDPSTDVQVYGTLLAIFKKQLDAQLPTMSAVA